MPKSWALWWKIPYFLNFYIAITAITKINLTGHDGRSRALPGGLTGQRGLVETCHGPPVLDKEGAHPIFEDKIRQRRRAIWSLPIPKS